MNNVYALPIIQRADVVARPRKAVILPLPSGVLLAAERRIQKREEDMSNVSRLIHLYALKIRAREFAEYVAREEAMKELRRGRSAAYAKHVGYRVLARATQKVWGDEA